MDKYLVNRQLPAAGDKRPRENTGRKDQAAYERKRKRAFVPSWAKEYFWLEYDDQKAEMFCRVCRGFPQLAEANNPFLRGTNHFRKDPIRTHNCSLHHKRCTEAQAAADNPQKIPMRKIVDKMNRSHFEILTRLFRTAYYIAKEELPLKKFAGLCKLQVANGVEINKGTYINDHACRDFIGAIAHTEKIKTKDQISGTRFISVLSDGSTDSGIIEQEIVYVRFVENNKPVTKMVQCEAVTYAHARGVLEAIDAAVENVGIDQEMWRKKVICANFDGASVMMGEKTGVSARLKQRIPHIITLHCVAHKLELAVLDAVKDVSYLETFEETLKSIFKFYYYSTKKRRELAEIGQLLEEKVAHFSGLKSTRKLPSRLMCLKAIQKNYSTVVSHMENVASSTSKDVKPEDAAKAKGIVQEMKTEKFVQFLHFMLDYSSILAKCSTNFQYDDINITSARYLLRSTTSDLLGLKTAPGEYQRSLNGSLITEGDQVTYKEIKLVKHKRPPRHVPAHETNQAPWKTDFTAIVDSTVKYMDARFANFSQTPLSCFSVFDPTMLPHEREELATYGYDEIVSLVRHFTGVLTEEEVEEIPREWTGLKIWLAAHRQHKLHHLFPDLLQHAPDNLYHIVLLVQILLTLSPSTAICERGFSCMNRVKTSYRTCLKADTLNDLMLLSTNGCDVNNCCADSSVKYWFFSGKGGRHLTHKTPAGRRKTGSGADEQASTSQLQQPTKRFNLSAIYKRNELPDTERVYPCLLKVMHIYL